MRRKWGRRSDLPYTFKRGLFRLRDGAAIVDSSTGIPPLQKLLGFGREILLVDDSRGPKARANGMHEGGYDS